MDPEQKSRLVFELARWSGVILIAAVYALISLGILFDVSWSQQLLKWIGILGIAAVLFYERSRRLNAMNVAWTVIALLALYLIFFR